MQSDLVIFKCDDGRRLSVRPVQVGHSHWACDVSICASEPVGALGTGRVISAARIDEIDSTREGAIESALAAGQRFVATQAWAGR